MGGFLIVVVSVVATALAGEQDSVVKTFKTDNGYGVASVAGVMSRNGRVSSVSGVNFFPSNAFYFSSPGSFMARSGDNIPEPITFSKEENGKFTAGQIKYGPGSVSVTSIARSVFPEDSTKMVKSSMAPVQSAYKPSNQLKNNDMIFQDPFAFDSRSLNPWFPNSFMFRSPAFQSFNSMRPGWPYSNFSPLFNFWRR